MLNSNSTNATFCVLLASVLCSCASVENGRVSVGLPPQLAQAVRPSAPVPAAPLAGYEKLVPGQTKMFVDASGRFEQAVVVLSNDSAEREKTCALIGKFAVGNADIRITLHVASVAASDEVAAISKALKAGAGKKQVQIEVVASNPTAKAPLLWVRDVKLAGEQTLAHVLVSKKLQLPG